MGDDLDSFLAGCTPRVSEPVVWGERMRLSATAYLGQDAPPLRYVTSVRAIVLRHASVLVQQDRDSRHVLPGGRREGDESLESTLRREVGEETGWVLGKVESLGFTHFVHLDPMPPGYTYPYPDFVQLVRVAEAVTYSPETRLDDGYEVGSELLPVAAVRRLPLTHIERIYLDAALRMNGSMRWSDRTESR
jgi:8-oxo-dGTP pyrophosphatase MutT (NUDIX family)